MTGLPLEMRLFVKNENVCYTSLGMKQSCFKRQVGHECRNASIDLITLCWRSIGQFKKIFKIHLKAYTRDFKLKEVYTVSSYEQLSNEIDYYDRRLDCDLAN